MISVLASFGFVLVADVVTGAVGIAYACVNGSVVVEFYYSISVVGAAMCSRWYVIPKKKKTI